MALFAGGAMGMAHAAAQLPGPPAVPAPLHGLWVSDDPEGQAQCDRYRVLADPWEHAGSAMVGMLLVRPGYLHEFSEYGEGTFYQLQQLRLRAPGRWQATAWLGIDQLPEPGDASPVDLRFLLEGKRLTVETDGRDYRDVKRWRYCTARLPGDAG
jgi:hypothetical protein